jgi:hypothetical protein
LTPIGVLLTPSDEARAVLSVESGQFKVATTTQSSALDRGHEARAALSIKSTELAALAGRASTAPGTICGMRALLLVLRGE